MKSRKEKFEFSVQLSTLVRNVVTTIAAIIGTVVAVAAVLG